MEIANVLEILRLEKKKGRELIVVLLSSIFALLLAGVLTPMFGNFAVKVNICHNSTDDTPKIHKDSILLTGGVRMLIAIVVALEIMSPSASKAVGRTLKYMHWGGKTNIT